MNTTSLLLGFLGVFMTASFGSVPRMPVEHVVGDTVKRTTASGAAQNDYVPVRIYRYSNGTSTYVGVGTTYRRGGIELMVTANHVIATKFPCKFLIDGPGGLSFDRGIASIAETRDDTGGSLPVTLDSVVCVVGKSPSGSKPATLGRSALNRRTARRCSSSKQTTSSCALS